MITTDLIADLFARYRAFIGVAIALITALAAWGHLREKDLSKPVEQREEETDDRILREVGDQFDVRRAECFLVIEAGDLFTREAVVAVRDVVGAVEDLEYVDRAVSIDNLPVLNAFGLPEPLLPRNSATAGAFDEARERVLHHPLVAGQLVSADGTTMLIPVVFDWLYVTDDADCSSRLLDVARQAAARHPEANLQVRVTGSVPLFVAQNEALKRNDRKFRLIGYALTGIIAIILFRGMTAVLIVAGAPALAIFWATGIIDLLEIERNDLTNAILPVLVTLVGMTDGVHLMVYIRRLRAAGSTPLESACDAIRHVGLACLLTSITTAIGFGSLLLAESPFIRDFGLACAVGVVISFVAVVTFIPLACSTRWARNVHVGLEHDLVGNKLQHFGGMIDWIIRHSRAVSLVAVGSTLAFGLVTLQLRPDGRRGNVLPAGSEAAQALTHCDEAFGGIDFARVVVQWPEDLPGESPRILEAVKDVEHVLAGEPLLRHPFSIRNIVDSFPGDDMSAAARMSFLQLMPPDLSRILFNSESRRALVTVRVQDLGLARYNPVFRRVEQELEQLEEQHAGFHFHLTGRVVVGGRDLTQIVYDLAASLGTASLVILIVISVVYGSLRTGLIAVVPNVFPLVLTGALLVLFGQALTVVSVCAFTVCIGIAVDDTIHFLTRFQQEVSTDGQVAPALHRTFLGVGNALVMTTIILVAGFSTVLMSELPAHRTFGAMACATIAAALLSDLVFLPAMLAWLARAATARPTEAAAESQAV